MILTAPNGATMDVCDEAVDRLLAAGFRKAEGNQKQKKELRSGKSESDEKAGETVGETAPKRRSRKDAKE